MIDFRELVKKGVHFGHLTSRWCPKMEPYIWGHKDKTHLIDVSKTAHHLEVAARFLESVAAQGKTILLVGTKRSAQDAIENAASQLGMPSVTHRWVGGTLSNQSQVKKSVTKLLHYEDVLKRSEQFVHYTKKELNLFQKRVARLEKNVGGIRNLPSSIGAIVLVDINKESAALHEAVQMRIPVVAIVDTDCDPSKVNYVIPANDDAPQSIGIIIDYLKDAIARGKEQAGSKQEATEAASAGQQASPEESIIEVAGVLSLVSDEDDQADKKKAKKAVVFTKGSAGSKKPRTTHEGDE
jgi:small subunit ribosomal protein S2